MALADREYMKKPQRGSGRMMPGFGQPGRKVILTMTMWLIIINVGVFVVDRAITGSGRGVRTELGMHLDSAYHSTPDRVGKLPDNGGEQPSPRYPGYREVPLFDRQTGENVGYEVIAYKGFFDSIGYFSTVRIAELEVWRFITFQFLHFDFMHLALNMIGLFFFGPIAERYLGSRRLFLAFYLTCGMAGAALYLILNLIGWLAVPSGATLPVVLANEPWVPLVGASAGVFGVLLAAAFIRPKDMMYLMGIIPIRIREGVYLFTAIAFVNLLTGGTNAGGDAAHIGGAIAGFFFIRRPGLLLDFFDDFLKTSDRHPAFERRKRKPGTTPKRNASRHDERFNRILDKVRDEGMGSLTSAEARFLERETQRRKGDG
jgi:membrane associated rhomboid family serine protease